MTTELIESPAQQVAAPPVQPPQAPRPLTIVESAARAGATPEQLVQLFQLQRDADNHQLDLMREKRRMDEEDRKRDSLLAYRRDFAAFKGCNIVIPKSKYVDRGRAGSFMQAEFGTASTMLAPALSEHGFGMRYDQTFGWRRVMTDGKENDVPWVYVTCFLEHRDGHAETLALEGPPGDLSANTPTQNMQATASYLKRQGLLALTGTATADEDDENKLRNGLPAARRRQETNEEQDADDALVDAGRAEAMKGMKALTAWWGALSAKQRSAMNSEFGALRKCATQADQENPQ